MKTNPIRLFWWNEKVFHNRQQENYGDLLGKYLVEKISGLPVKFTKPRDFSIRDLFSPIYVTIGSILAHVNSKCVVWGSGIISKSTKVKKARFIAVRGPLTRKHLIEQGYHVPEVYGDPALLLPLYYNPSIEKEYKLGIIPHYVDYNMAKEQVKSDSTIHVINLLTDDIESTTREILACERIVSTSLHGLIVPHAYGIPAIWLKVSDKLFGDDVKFEDYLASVNIPPYTIRSDIQSLTSDDISKYFYTQTSQPTPERVRYLQEGLLACCPFKTDKRA